MPSYSLPVHVKRPKEPKSDVGKGWHCGSGSVRDSAVSEGR